MAVLSECKTKMAMSFHGTVPSFSPSDLKKIYFSSDVILPLQKAIPFSEGTLQTKQTVVI
jgi:hypothetical protein